MKCQKVSLNMNNTSLRVNKRFLYETWIAALRSGKYAPTRHRLKDENDKFCCLGVVCDIYPLGYWTGSNKYIDNDEPYDLYLPRTIQKLLKLQTRTGEFDIKELSQPLQERIKAELNAQSTQVTLNYSLIALNDVLDLNVAFPIIADVLEEAPPSLFK